ncbi:MAG: ATP-binding protein [Bacteroidota bacterium]
MNNTRSLLDRFTFGRLSRLYSIALSAIALSILISQILVQRHLQSQLSDSRVVNVAGRQRMLSQKLTKEALLLADDKLRNDSLLSDFEATLQQWTSSHDGLQNGDNALGLPGNNSATIQEMFKNLKPIYRDIVKSAKALSAAVQINEANTTSTSTYIDQLLQNEPFFLEYMNNIVFQFDEEAKEKVSSLREKEIWLLLLSLSILLAELVFLFRPTALQLHHTIKNLVQAEQQSSAMAEKVKTLYAEKENSLRELQSLNFALDQAALFASATTQGDIIYLSRKFCALLGIVPQEAVGNIAEIMSTQEGEQQYLKELIQVNRSNIWNSEVKITTRGDKKCWLEMSVVPVNREGVKQDLLILCSDVTARKVAQEEIVALKETQFDEQIRQQKLRSSQVVEAQEEERKRIARDMHDGIGQMLTALRFNLQSINIQKQEKAEQKLSKVNEIATSLIRGVRIATFNLTPPELSDYGVAPALAKLAQELSKLTGERILFHNRTQFNKRFESIIETNLYRITQEAVNNAIKYANANYILVTLSHSNELLSILVEDDGAGFDTEEYRDRPSEDGSGMGISFMKERIHFINGRLFIRSEPGEGTRITVNVPFESTN